MARPAPSGGLATQHAPPLDLPFRFLAVGVGSLALLAATYALHLPLLPGSFYDRHLIAFVHVNTLGLIGATILGASYQLLPVVLQVPLASVRAARLSWWLYLPGLVLFVLGVGQGWTALLAIGGGLVFVAIGHHVGVAVGTLRRAPHRDAVFWHIAAATAGLAVGASVGLLLAVSKATGLLGDQTLPVLGAHVVLMVGGWVTPMLTGVALRLVGMFTLSEDQIQPTWAWAELGLLVAGVWTLAASLLLGLGSGPAVVGSAAVLAATGLFAAQLVRLYRRRRRRTIDVHMPFALAATVWVGVAAGLLLWGFASQQVAASPVWIAVGWLAIVGWAETAIQGFLYKIGTFLTWLHRYAPLAGRQPVPKLEDLYGRRTAIAGWACWTAGVGLGGLAALSRVELLAYLAAIGLSAGAAALLVNVARVGGHWRAPREAAVSRRQGPAASKPKEV